jgi:hypothetical protein
LSGEFDSGDRIIVDADGTTLTFRKAEGQKAGA